MANISAKCAMIYFLFLRLTARCETAAECYTCLAKGMLIGLLGSLAILFVTPAFFIVFQWMEERGRKRH